MVIRAGHLALGSLVGATAAAGLAGGAYLLIMAVEALGLPPMSLAVILPAYGVGLVWLNVKFGGPF